MKALCDAGNIGINLFELRKHKVVTLPPLPMSFEGTFDLLPFFLYDSLVMDGNSIEYLFQENLLSDKSKDLLKGLLQDGIIEEEDYVKLLRPLKDKIWQSALKDYDSLKRDIYEKGPKSRYFASKTEWLEFASRIDKLPQRSIHFPDTEQSVRKNLSRVISKKLIPRDYKFLEENVIDVNCATVFSEELNLPLYCWSDWGPYYELKADHQTRAVMKRKTIEGEIATTLWKLIFPRLDLHRVSPEAFRKLLDSHAISDIREFVQTTYLTPEAITKEWFEEIKKRSKEDRFEIGVFQVFALCSSCFVGLTADPLVGVGVGVCSFLGERLLVCLEKHSNRLAYSFRRARELMGEHVG